MDTTERRRSQRLPLDVPVVVWGLSLDQKAFQEGTFTISVSAHGALVILGTTLVLGQTLFLRNLRTQDEMKGRVARLGPPHGEQAQIGIEFARPAPKFWSVELPPDSWKLLNTRT
jgi:hypothetical protein